MRDRTARGRVFACVIVTLPVLGLAVASSAARKHNEPRARAARSCGVIHGRVHGYPGRSRIHAIVHVRHGNVSCRTARRVGRLIITDKGECHSGDPGYCIVLGRWLGGKQTGGWEAYNTKHPRRVVGGKAWGAIDG